MANADHVELLWQGVESWNAWRAQVGPAIRPDLSDADLSNADLFGANLSTADLSNANLSNADLSDANLSRANLSEANLSQATLAGANLGLANLNGTDLRRAILSTVNFFHAKLYRANLAGADLISTCLIEAQLDYADLTDANLWETQRSGWSIKGVICQRAFWDRDAAEPIEYAAGEFERIFAVKPQIILHYPGGISPVDLLALPLILERLKAEHPGTVLRVDSMRNDAGGASVTLTVEDLEERETNSFAAEVEMLRDELLAIQHRLHTEESLRLTIEAKYQAVIGDVLPLLLQTALPKQEFNIGQLTAPMIVESVTMNRDTYNISGQAGGVGPRAHVHRNTFHQSLAGIELPKLAHELGRLREAMNSGAAGTREQSEAIGAVAAAEQAAVAGDGPAVLHHLKGAGKWALRIAEKIGIPVVTEALKRAM